MGFTCFILMLLVCIVSSAPVDTTAEAAHAQAAKTIESIIAQLQALLKELKSAPPSGCKGFPCEKGYHCELFPTVCVMAPCDFPPMPACVPNKVVKSINQ